MELIEAVAWVIKKALWSIWTVLEFLGERLLDGICLVCGLVVFLTVYKFRTLVKELTDWDCDRFLCVQMFCLVVFDLVFVLPPFLVLHVTGWRCLALWRDLRAVKQHNSSIVWDYRSIILRHFAMLFVDLVFVPTGIIVLLSWRHRLVRAKMAAVKGDKLGLRMRFVIVRHCFLVLFADLPCLLLGLALCCTTRLPFLVRDLRRHALPGDKTWTSSMFRDARSLVFENLLLLVADIATIAVLPLALLTWRLYFAVDQVRHINWKWTQNNVRELIFIEAGLFVLDVPCLLCAIVAAPYRGRFFARPFDSDNASSHDSRTRQHDVRLRLVYHAFVTLVDPCVLLLALFVFVTLWRSPPLVRTIRKVRAKWASERARRQAQQATAAALRAGIDAGASITASAMPTDHSPFGQRAALEASPVTSLSAWPLRRKIATQFALLLIDIPLLAIALFLALTGLRTMSLLGALASSSDFYKEFEITVVSEARLFLIDLVHLLLFLVLVCARPIAIFVHLLEDDVHHDHRRQRRIVETVLGIVEAERAEALAQAADLLSTSIKRTAYSLSLRDALHSRYVELLQAQLDAHNELGSLGESARFGHLLHKLVWLERSERVRLLQARLKHEVAFVRRPDDTCHRANLMTLAKDEASLASVLEQVHSDLADFKSPSVPLWASETGLSSRTRAETRSVVVACLTHGSFVYASLVLLNLFGIYRFPQLVRDTQRRWYDRRDIAIESLREYARDAAGVFSILLTLVCVWRALPLLSDLARDLFQQRSWRLARDRALEYPPDVLEDISQALSLLTRWSTYRFLVATLLWSALLPVEAFQRALKEHFSATLSVVVAAVLAVLSMAFPLWFTLDLASSWIAAGNVSLPLVATLSFSLALLGTLLVLLPRQSAREAPAEPFKFVRWNWANVLVLAGELLETLQLVALSFSLPNLLIPLAHGLETAARGLLFNDGFGSVEVRLWLAVALFALWVLTISAPEVLERVVDHVPRDTVRKSVGWRLLASLLGDVLFVTVCESLLSVLACTNAAPALLRDDPSVVCWTGSHSTMAAVGFFAFAWYTITAVILGISYRLSDGTADVDLRTARLFSALSSLIKAMMVICAVFLGSQAPVVALSLLLALSLVLLFSLALFPRLYGYAPVNSTAMWLVKATGYALSAWTALSLLLAQTVFRSTTSGRVYVMLLCGYLVIFGVLAMLIVMYAKASDVARDRQAVKRRLLAVERTLVDAGVMMGSWMERRAAWQRRVKMVVVAQPDDELETDVPPVPPPLRYIQEEATAAGADTEDDQEEMADLGPAPAYASVVDTVPTSTADVEPDNTALAAVGATTSVSSQLNRGAGTTVPDTRLELDALEDGADITDVSSNDTGSDQLPEISSVPVDGHAHTAIPEIPPRSAVSLGNPRKSSRPAPLAMPSRTRSSLAIPHFSGTIRAGATTVAEMEARLNGADIFIALEHYIRYEAFTISQLHSELSEWRRAARVGSWTGLLRCLSFLETIASNNSTKRFASTRVCDNVPNVLHTEALEEDTYVPNSASLTTLLDAAVPPFVLPSPEELAARALEARTRFLSDVRTNMHAVDDFMTLLDRIIPPNIDAWEPDVSGGAASASPTFLNGTLRLRRAQRGTITEVSPGGVGLAKGAVVAVPDRLHLCIGRNEVSLSPGLRCSKSGISLLVTSIVLREKRPGEWKVGDGTRSAALDKALLTVGKVAWR